MDAKTARPIGRAFGLALRGNGESTVASGRDGRLHGWLLCLVDIRQQRIDPTVSGVTPIP
ncbi:hypothetical protein ACS15_0776 [Ralstonia insidiosa]|uniref:Uncharacterized protein n=1 Tax=Ralstonia insidiosa TaxID=190721 RepID=A0AAC9BFV6_9RALS|nr:MULTISPECIES: hypothetical protein [Ralstonia]ANH73558.1 hypothetical protein ACS15_0776 [Ralstonia insidiosa]EPX96057.1 hypothetical protein C404_22405 [Ralstonia sp. AU12-08]MBY4706675.1 hypothetical protein [Ralstonia insidiosa]GAQ27744.1 hypothetical protein SAMD00023378_1427 [Ralstonia sp. NT80]